MTRPNALAAVELVARRQYGLFTTGDALTAGVTKTMVHRHSRPGGRWRRYAPRVYEVLAEPADWHRPLMAALLWGGPEAVLAGHSAGTVLDLDGLDRAKVELYVPTGRPHPPWTVRRGSPPAQTTRRLRHTDVLETLRDLTRTLDLDHLERALESVLRKQLATEAELRDQPSLRTVLARRPAGAPPTGSEAETRMVQLLRTADVPEPARQYAVGPIFLDLAFPDVGIFIEVDGRASHDRPQALLYDRHRQNRVVRELGWTPLRYTWEDITARPTWTARDVESCYHRALTSAARGRARQ